MKIFEKELEKFYYKLQEKKPFAFSKYADGEWGVIQGHHIDNGEFNFERQEQNEFYREKLIESFKYKNPEYYVGISCECCQGQNHLLMKEQSGQDEDHLTYANLFVNTNYPLYVNNFIPEYQNHKIYLVANEKAKIQNLPFKIEKFYPVGDTAFIKNYDMIEQIKSENIKDSLFLFCAGPFGNILAHQLFKSNPNNIYMDIGSTLNPWLQSEGFKRDYYINGFFASRKCIWN
jgi:hypothetical protein